MEYYYYVGYNQAEGINGDTTEDRDKVMIILKEGEHPESYGEAINLAWLDPENRQNRDQIIQIVIIDI